jgi:phenylalanyl-tRNA synthetase beta chain
LQRAASLIVEVCGGTVVSDTTDIFPTPFTKASVVYSWARTNSLIGKELGKDRVKAILNDLDIQITAENDEALTLSIPYYRTDVTREADVVEEILRIYGYDNIEFPKGIKSSLSFPAKPDAEKVQHQVATFLSANGFSEIMSMSLTKARYRDLVNEEEYNAATSVELLNPLSNDLAVMRQSVLYSGLEAVGLNQNYRNADLRLYEFGKEYRKREGKYEEEQHLAIFMTGRKSIESWNNGNDSVSFYDLKSAVESILNSLGLDTYTIQSVEGSHYDDGLVFNHGKNVLVKLGWVAGAMLKAFDVKQPVLFADFKWANVLKALPKNAIQYKAPEKYPAVRRDLSLLFDRAVKYADIEKLAHESERKLLKSVGLFDVYEGKNLEAGKKSYAVSFVMQDSTKTMTDQQVDQAMSRIQKALEEKLGGVLRG